MQCSTQPLLPYLNKRDQFAPWYVYQPGLPWDWRRSGRWEMQLNITVKREHLKPQTKEVTVLRAQVRKEVVIMSNCSLSCSRRSREVAGQAATQWPQLCIRGPWLYCPQWSCSRSLKEQLVTIYWMIVVLVACVAWSHGSTFLLSFVKIVSSALC